MDAYEKAMAQLKAINDSLLPCPFCGSREVEYYTTEDDLWGGSSTVKCNACCAHGPKEYAWYENRDVSAQIVTAWNRRCF